MHAAAPCPVHVKRADDRLAGPDHHRVLRARPRATASRSATRRTGSRIPAPSAGAILGELLILDEDGDERAAGRGRGHLVPRGDRVRLLRATRTRRPRAGRTTGLRAPSATSATSTRTGTCTSPTARAYMIISGGVNIYPQETENLLSRCTRRSGRGGHRRPERRPGRGGQGGGAARWIRPAPGRSSTQELITYCRDRLAHFKCPRTVDFVSELPRLGDRQAVQARAPR